MPFGGWCVGATAMLALAPGRAARAGDLGVGYATAQPKLDADADQTPPEPDTP